jgi:SAM-dependent methyltransferase/glycosyltransferase involved in cell wall biosynthesis
LKQEPRAKLYLATYDNPVAEMAPYYAMLKAKMDALGDAVVPLAPMTKAQLYRLMKGMRVYAYPTPAKSMAGFAEISCIAAMEAQACGLPIVTSARGALPETVDEDGGMLVHGDPWSPEYRKAFVDEVLRLFRDEAEWALRSAECKRHAASLDWSGVAKEWSAKFETEIKARSAADTPRGAVRLARHFWRQSDIMALKALRGTTGIEMGGDVLAQMDDLYRPFQFIETEEGCREQYAKIGFTHDDRIFEGIQFEPRFDVMKKWMQRTPQVKTVLDYGCGLGGYAIYAHKLCGVKVTALDIDQSTIDIGMKKRDEMGVSKGDVTFGLSSEVDLVEPVDCGVMQEVLEHVAEPWKLAQRVEARVKPGGYVYITVPFGPWEYASYRNYPHRCHVWHFDRHDIRDMFGAKPECSVFSVMYSDSPELGEALGWWVIIYKADHKTIPPINMERKLWLQRPRQTVSVNIMAGGDKVEDTLHWCMKPLLHIADEVVIADTGLTAESVRILQRHRDDFIPMKIVKSVDPKTEGFETPRNHALEASTSDWILWIDTDEKLIDPVNLHKYLRSNEYSAYQLRQHHFACDTSYKPDLPCRLFRNGGIRFYGMVHEHPETALNKGPGPSVVISDAHIAHVGYLIESDRRVRFTRNFPMLQKDIERYPNRILQKHFIMRDTVQLLRQQIIHNGGVVTEQMRNQAAKVVALYREHFLGKDLHSSLDPLEYYSEACKILGEGFEVDVALSADKVEVTDEASLRFRARFATKDDYLKYITHKAERQVAPLVAENY